MSLIQVRDALEGELTGDMAAADIALVLVEDGETVGQMCCVLTGDAPSIYGLDVRTKNSNGLSALYQAMRGRIKSLGYDTVYVGITEQNVKLMKTLIKLGYKKVSTAILMRGGI